ncbi:MAG: TadE family protein [Candidatus Omnitrophota bacterium]|nr:pilus assembly protein [Candidatus Omnitrophota bacterium]MBU2528489.1 pilus assembly protein [bacterium]MBU3930803.1 pilus assembly protein [bacterium]MBU4122412.1 pilus assembly protein [bacterium]
MKKNLKSPRAGQAMAEMVICLIVLPLFITAIVRFGQTLIIQQRLLMAAKHGAILRSTNLVADTYVRGEVLHFLDRGTPKLERSRITISLAKTSYFGNPISHVTVGYRIRVPKFSKSFFQPFSTEEITLREEAYCADFRRLSGTPYLPDI